MLWVVIFASRMSLTSFLSQGKIVPAKCWLYLCHNKANWLSEHSYLRMSPSRGARGSVLFAFICFRVPSTSNCIRLIGTPTKKANQVAYTEQRPGSNPNVWAQLNQMPDPQRRRSRNSATRFVFSFAKLRKAKITNKCLKPDLRRTGHGRSNLCALRILPTGRTVPHRWHIQTLSFSWPSEKPLFSSMANTII